jgi:hypothetical protein
MYTHLWRWCAMGSVAIAAALTGTLARSHPGQAAEFSCASGDVACLIQAIHEANANGEANTITLEAGTYPLTAVDNNTNGSNGLPSIASPLTLRGAGAAATVIERTAGSPRFRLVHVAATGALTLEGLTLRAGLAGSGARFEPGGGLLNTCRLILSDTTLANNRAHAGGGLAASGTELVTNTTVPDNEATVGGASSRVTAR